MNKSFGTGQISRATASPSTRAAGECERTRLGRAAWLAFGLALALFGAQAGAAPFAYIPSSTGRQVVVIDIGNNNRLLAGAIDVGLNAIGIAVSPVNNRAYVANNGDTPGTVTVIDAANQAKLTTIATGRSPFGIAVNPAGTRVYVANINDNVVTTIDTATNQLTGLPVQVGTQPTGIAVNPAGTRVYVANFGSNTLSVIDAQTNQVLTIPVGTRPEGVAVNPVLPRVYVANRGSGTVSVIDTNLNTVVETVAVGAEAWGIVVNRTGDRVFITNTVADGTVTVLDTQNNSVIKTIRGVGAGPLGIDITPDGNTLYVVNAGAGANSVQRIAVNILEPLGAPIAVGTAPFAFGTFILPGAAAACTFSLNPPSSTSPGTGGPGSVTVTASASTCTWTATTTAAWITIPAGTFTGSGPLSYQVGDNSGGGQRTGTITVAGQLFTVTQAAGGTTPPPTPTPIQAGVTLDSATLSPGGRCTISGTALDARGSPAVALALASGRCMFTDSPSAFRCTGELVPNQKGKFLLSDLPLEANGSVVLQIFVSGLVSLTRPIPGCQL